VIAVQIGCGNPFYIHEDDLPEVVQLLERLEKKEHPACTRDPNTCVVNYCDFPACLHDEDFPAKETIADA